MIVLAKESFFKKFQFLKQWHLEKSIFCYPFHPGHIPMIIASKDSMLCKRDLITLFMVVHHTIHFVLLA